MRYIVMIMSFIFLINTDVLAQDRGRDAIENEKIAFITKELNLTPNEAQQFFPLYNEYNKMMWNLRSAKMGGKNYRHSGEQKDVIEYDSKEVEIKKDYRVKFTKVIGASRSSRFFEVEQEFRQHLYQELKNRRSGK